MAMNTKKGFTLIELLVVVAVISVLAALLMPALRNALDQARTIVCLNNERQLGLLVNLYADDSRDFLPAGSFGYPANWDASIWSVWLSKYSAKPISTYHSTGALGTIFDCPMNPRDYWCHVAFGWNINLPPPHGYSALSVFGERGKIKKPSQVKLLAEAGFIWIGWGQNYKLRHRQETGINLLYADLHARTLTEEEYGSVGEWGY